MFLADMREKGIKVALANGSLMTKLVSFSISLRELECNSVYFGVHAFLLVLKWLIYSHSTAIGSLVMSVTIGGLIMALLVV